MTTIHRLENPDGRIVTGAVIQQPSKNVALLCVATTSGRTEHRRFNTLRGAKISFGIEFQSGGKWRKE